MLSLGPSPWWEQGQEQPLKFQVRALAPRAVLQCRASGSGACCCCSIPSSVRLGATAKCSKERFPSPKSWENRPGKAI